mmetsp:Transcript_48492/g.93620  ORF Transcript_48492/g.93620 Transcript_48492/m.93620 type:complete len:119 (-) Transcript_48492:1267-1623(-)
MLLVLPPSAVEIITLIPGCRTSISCPFFIAVAAPSQVSSCGRPGVRGDAGDIGGRGDATSGEATIGGLCVGPSTGEGDCTRNRRAGSDSDELPMAGEETSRRTFVDGELHGGGTPIMT